MTGNGIQEPVAFDFIRYANCWEDPALLLGAMEIDGRKCVSIASGGDNSLALLIRDPELVVAFDLNPAQLAVVELKMAAIREFDDETFRRFLGFSPSDKRGEFYRQLRLALPERSRNYFDAHPEIIARGVIHCGKFERYFQLFSRWILPLTHNRSERAMLLAEKSAAERRSFYHEVWNNRRFRGLYRLFFNRWVMGRLGRDPEFFKYVDAKPISQRLKERTDYALAELPTHDNPYLHYIVNADFGPALPDYARPENLALLRLRLDRLQLVEGSLAEVRRRYPQTSFDFFNLSDIFEYLDEDLCGQVTAQVLEMATPGARIAYYNMLAPRRLTAFAPERLRGCETLAQELFGRNRAFFYSAFFIDEVKTS